MHILGDICSQQECLFGRWEHKKMLESTIG